MPRNVGNSVTFLGIVLIVQLRSSPLLDVTYTDIFYALNTQHYQNKNEQLALFSSQLAYASNSRTLPIGFPGLHCK